MVGKRAKQKQVQSGMGLPPRFVRGALAAFLVCILFQSLGQLICAGGIFIATGIALEQVYGLLCVLSLQKLADGLKVARTAADKGEIMDLSVVESKGDEFGTDAVGNS